MISPPGREETARHDQVLRPFCLIGSAYYMLPEQIEGKPTDGRSDLYSLGVILFQALTGRVPFDGENTAPWGALETAISGARGTAVGTGQQNTAAIIASQGTGSTYAAQLCDDLTAGGFSDWFLPSKDELALIYTNLYSQGLGGFGSGDLD